MLVIDIEENRFFDTENFHIPSSIYIIKIKNKIKLQDY